MASKRQICACGQEFLAIRGWTACKPCRDDFVGVLDLPIGTLVCADCGNEDTLGVRASNGKTYCWECAPADDAPVQAAIAVKRQQAAAAAAKAEAEYEAALDDYE